MKVNCNYKRDISFEGFWSSKFAKKGLEFASNNGALFAATTTLALSAGVRPAAIMLAPKTEKENKKIACAKSITSGFLEFLLTLAISAPIAAAFKKIDKNPTKYLKSETIINLKNNASGLKESKAYSLATQLFKLGIGFAVVLPKAILTSLGIPFVMKSLPDEQKKQIEYSDDKADEITFKSRGEGLPRLLGKLLDDLKLQKLVNKYKDSNFPLHIFALKDIFATFAFVYQANMNNMIKEEQKPFLVKNSFISTVLSILSSYTIDKVTEKPAEKIIEKIKAQNANDPKLAKYLEGFRIVKPIIILAVVYYTLIPFISTILSQKSENKTK